MMLASFNVNVVRCDHRDSQTERYRPLNIRVRPGVRSSHGASIS
jgi:hypothetical protein